VKLLVTGFEPYGVLSENPSETIVRELSRRAAVRPDDYPDLRVAILPTEFAKAERAIRELLHNDVPDVLLALGVAPRAQSLRLERTARNRDDAALTDNAGDRIGEDTQIVGTGLCVEHRRPTARRRLGLQLFW
jgi:pyroglutamyl-peptidase